MTKRGYDVFLPPFEVEEITDTRAITRPYSWGVEALQVEKVWPTADGSNCVLFVIDTEDSAIHDAMDGVAIPQYCKRFTDEPSGIPGGGGHGLHVADTALQMAPGLVVGFLKVLRNDGVGRSEWVANGIKWAADMPLLSTHKGFHRIINMSLGSDYPSQIIYEAIKYARAKGVHIFCAAGNDGQDIDYPGVYPDVIAVGAVDRGLKPAAFSSPGKEVDLAAPGVSIAGAYKNGYALLTGTSMATPHAAGVGAAILSAGWSSDLLTDMPKKATDIDAPGFDTKTGWGLPIAPNYATDKPEPGPGPEPTPRVKWWVWVIIVIAVLGGLVATGIINL